MIQFRPASERQLILIRKLIQSHVFTDYEREKVQRECENYTFEKASKSIEYIMHCLKLRKLKEKENAAN